MNFSLGQESDVAHVLHPLDMRPAQTPQGVAVLLRFREVVHLVAVVLQVVKFLPRLGLPKLGLRFVELAGVVHVMPDARGRGLEHVRDELAINFVRHVVADVNVAPVEYRAHHVVTLVHAPAEAKAVLLRRSGVFAHERVSLHVRRRLHSGDAQHRRGEVDEANQLIADAASLVTGRCKVLVLLRHVHDERHI